MTVEESPGFILTQAVLGNPPRISLSRQEFGDLVRARKTVVESLGVEERMNLVLQNYIDYEKVLLEGALEALVFRTGSWEESSRGIYEVNRRVLNLLASCRTYIDQLRRFASRMYGKASCAYDEIIGYLNEEYDQRLGYRAMEALRNFAQHRGMAVHGLKQQRWWVKGMDPPMSKVVVVPWIDLPRLVEEGGFKRSVLVELEELGEQVDLRPLLKDHVAGIGAAHSRVRKRMEEDLAWADRTWAGAMERYSREAGSAARLVAAELKGDGTLFREVRIFKGPVERRKELERRNRLPGNLKHHFVTNEPKDGLRG